jgi:transposase
VLGACFRTTSSALEDRPSLHFRKWRIDGTWEKINLAVRERLRARLKRNPQPSASIVDSQSIKTTGVGREERGIE